MNKPQGETLSRHVYFMQAGDDGPIKIGVSDNPRVRLGQLQTASPYPLRLLASYRASAADEVAAHARFERHRLHGEWFAPDTEILSFIDDIRARGLDSLCADYTSVDSPPVKPVLTLPQWAYEEDQIFSSNDPNASAGVCASPASEWTTVRVPGWATDALDEVLAFTERYTVAWPSDLQARITGKNLSRGQLIGLAASLVVRKLSPSKRSSESR